MSIEKQAVYKDTLELALLFGKPIFISVHKCSMKYVSLTCEGLFESEDGVEWFEIKDYLPEPSDN